MPFQIIPENEPLVLMKGITVPDDTIVINEPIYVGHYEDKTLYVDANYDTTVSILGGPHPDRLYLLVSGTNVQTEDEARQWDVNDQRKFWKIDEHIQYLVVKIADDGSGGVINEVALSGG